MIVLSNDPEYRTAGGHHYIKQYVRVYSENENGDADTVIMDHGIEFNADLAYQAGAASAPSYTRYTFVKTSTQSSDGYHYTFSISTGWTATFGADGGTYYLYKRN